MQLTPQRTADKLPPGRVCCHTSHAQAGERTRGLAASPAKPQDHDTQNKQTGVVAIDLHNLQGHIMGC